jgi:pimeloyl-ACP methyl ester carboxylesterase
MLDRREAGNPLLRRPGRHPDAYAVHGSGPPLVRSATWLTHLEFDWESPVWRHWLDGLAEGHTVIRYDERGCGLSDRDVEDVSLDARRFSRLSEPPAVPRRGRSPVRPGR